MTFWVDFQHFNENESFNRGVISSLMQINQLFTPLPVLKRSLTCKEEHPSQGYGAQWPSSENTKVEYWLQTACRGAVKESLGGVSGCEGSMAPQSCKFAHKRAG